MNPTKQKSDNIYTDDRCQHQLNAAASAADEVFTDNEPKFESLSLDEGSS